MSDEKFFFALLYGKNSYLVSERTRRNISVDIALYIKCNEEFLPVEISNLYKDAFDQFCTEVLVDIKSEVDQFHESHNLGVPGRIASARKRKGANFLF